MDPLSVLAATFKKVALPITVFIIPNPMMVGSIAKFKAPAAIPAATRVPAVPPLPTSPAVKLLIPCSKALSAFLVSDPNIASNVSSP